MRRLIGPVAIFALLILDVHANTEKAIFTTPQRAERSSNAIEWISKLGLTMLSPEKTSVRVSVPVIFPTSKQPRGLEHWYLLHSLPLSSRYELRACWAAIQPTAVDVDVYDYDKVRQNIELSVSLDDYTRYSPQSQIYDDVSNLGQDKDQHYTTMLLRLSVAADFYTSNKTLMQNPPDVTFDLILDRFWLGILPESLIPTVMYILVISLLGIVISDKIWLRLNYRETTPENKVK